MYGRPHKGAFFCFKMMKSKLFLADGTILEGDGFGAPVNSAGEVVFNTAMTGYVESLTDPSYAGQILVLTYPLVGNYGVPNLKLFQSEKIQVSGLIVTKHCLTPSHHQSKGNLDSWLKENTIPAISEIDTRALTQKLRTSGTMLGKIIVTEENTDFYDPNKENIVEKVSVKKIEAFSSGHSKKTVCLLDCGYKKAILDCLLQRQVNVIVLPWNFNPFTTTFKAKFDGVLVSNGPGDPKAVSETIAITKMAIEKGIPVLGICLGNQILALASGAETYKLKFGHRSVNQPVKDLFTKRCFITSQNHGFAVNTETLLKGFKPWFINLNDATCEGIKSDDGRYCGVQFHPEGHPGPQDTDFVFDNFIKQL